MEASRFYLATVSLLLVSGIVIETDVGMENNTGSSIGLSLSSIILYHFINFNIGIENRILNVLKSDLHETKEN